MPEPAAPSLERIAARSERGVQSIVDLALGRDPDRPPVTSSVKQPYPKSKLTRQLHNRTVRAPRSDWEAIVTGRKRMYRSYSDSWRDRFAPLLPASESYPRPAVIFSPRPGQYRQVDTALAIILSYRQEPLGAISHADLRAEGFARGDSRRDHDAAIRRFRRYWQGRYWRWGWRPMDLVSVVELRPWTEADYEWTCAWMFDQLYGDWRE